MQKFQNKLNDPVIQLRQFATCRPGRPKITWRTLTEKDSCEWKLNKVDPCDRDVWRSIVRSAMHATSQLPGGEPTDVDDAPAPAC